MLNIIVLLLKDVSASVLVLDRPSVAAWMVSLTLSVPSTR